MKADIFTYRNPSPSPAVAHGLLAGKSFIVQPTMSVRGWPTDAGSLALKGFTAIEDATAIARLKAAGGVMVGSTRMSEFGLGLHGDTAGLALSQGLADAALMTDMMGEPRITAARAGAYGFKPTGGIVSRFGLIGLVPSMESFAIVAHSPADIAAVMSIIAGSDHRDLSLCDGPAPPFADASSSDGGIKTIGIIRECIANLTDEEAGAFMSGIERLKRGGGEVKEVSLPDFDLFRTVHHVVGSVEASSSCGKYDGVRYGHRTASAKNWNEMYLKTRAECFGLTVKTYLFQGAYFQFQNYAAFEKASRIRAGLAKSAHELFATVDALVFPTRRRGLPGAGRGVADIYDECALTLPANVLGLPALHMPGFVREGSSDYGLQMVGARFSDARLLSHAARLSQKEGA
jgi:aspartyl-tRNA(Asn)/glutamyl-tRNA(Gln) amidotransferase subunit A